MLGFILSKLNLLILVVALFAIISYFWLNLGQVMKQNAAQIIVAGYSRELETVLGSATYCDKTVLTVPSSIRILGQERLFFTLKISQVDNDDDPFNGNILIFSVKPTNQKEILGASSALSKAQIHLFERNYLGDFIELPDLEKGIVLDPQSIPPKDAIGVIKKKKEGKDHLYIIPCTIPSTSASQADICEREISIIAKEVLDFERVDQFEC